MLYHFYFLCFILKKKQKTKTIESKRRRRLPPTRLAWPGGADVGIATDSVPGIDSFCKPKQIGNAGRKGRDTHGFANSTFRSSIGTTHPKTAVPAKRKIRNDEMWVDKYKPTNSKSLCVANKKIKEVKDSSKLWESVVFSYSWFSFHL
jgi:hypothetical protein